MNGIFENLVENGVQNYVQCYGCPVFDRLFKIVSESAAAIYGKMMLLVTILFCIMFGFFVINAVWQNLKKGAEDSFYQKSVLPVFLHSLLALALLWIGVALPRTITQITFEPVASITTIYTQNMLHLDSEDVTDVVTYTPIQLSDDGFFRPELRDKIILLMKTTITQFQSYMKLGLAVMESAFKWVDLWAIGEIIRQIIVFFVGLYLFIGFFKLFFKFCCYFVDIIVAMVLFAFFFPISLVLIPFSGVEGVPSWLSGLGKQIGLGQTKKLIDAIISLGAAVITYTVIMVIIAKFFSSQELSTTEIMNAITTGKIFNITLDTDSLETLTITGTIVLLYLINFLQEQIPQVKEMILAAFNVKTETSMSEQLAQDTGKLTKSMLDYTKGVGLAFLTGGEKAPGGDKDGKKDDKKDDKK